MFLIIGQVLLSLCLEVGSLVLVHGHPGLPSNLDARVLFCVNDDGGPLEDRHDVRQDGALGEGEGDLKHPQ